jgi:predicted ribosome quality control (RQC) complex YloA/Tae2 family protein
LNATESYTVFEVLQSILSQVVNGKLEPVIVLDEAGAFIDVLPVKLKRYEDLKHQFYSSFNEALDEFYIRAKALEKTVAGIETDSLKREAERLRRIIESQEKTTVDAEARAERERQIGDTIYAHTSELQTLMSRFLTERQARKDWNLILSEISAQKKNGLKPSLLFESFDARNLTLNVNIDGVVFGLTLRRSLFENAADFYERGKHAKQKLEGAKNALGDSRNKLAEIEAKIKKAESLEITRPTEAMEELAKRKVKHKEWFEKFRSFISSDGFMVVAGKDAVSNEVLIKKHAEAWDVIFHSDVVGAPFVVIKTEGKEPSGQVLKEAAEFAASFSRGWREGFGSVDVYWVRPEQLSKKGPSGEYVPHGAFVVSGKRNWMRNVPLKLAIGAVGEEKSEVEFIGGPVDAVKAKAQTYTMLIPGDLSGKELLKRVLVSIGQKVPKEMRERIMKASIESIREFVPYGTGRVLEAD